MQAIFYIDDNAKAEAERIIAEQNAEGDEAKQIYIQTNEKYRQTYTIPLKQCIELSFQKLKLASEENEMLSSTQLKPLTYIDNAFDSLFAFIDNPELEPHNNYCEANFKDLLRVRRNNNDMARSKEEVRRIAHYRTFIKTLTLNRLRSFKEQLSFHYSLIEAQFINAVNQATSLIFAAHKPVKDPSTGFFDITSFMKQFKISHFSGSFKCSKFMFDLMTSKGVSFPSDLDDNLNRLFRREELTIQINREMVLSSYLHRFKFDSRLEEIKLAYPKLLNCDAAQAELNKMEEESRNRRNARLNKSSDSNTVTCTEVSQTKDKGTSSRKSERCQDLSISSDSVNQNSRCSYELSAAS